MISVARTADSNYQIDPLCLKQANKRLFFGYKNLKFWFRRTFVVCYESLCSRRNQTPSNFTMNFLEIRFIIRTFQAYNRFFFRPTCKTVYNLVFLVYGTFLDWVGWISLIFFASNKSDLSGTRNFKEIPELYSPTGGTKETAIRMNVPPTIVSELISELNLFA